METTKVVLDVFRKRRGGWNCPSQVVTRPFFRLEIKAVSVGRKTSTPGPDVDLGCASRKGHLEIVVDIARRDWPERCFVNRGSQDPLLAMSYYDDVHF